MHQYRYNIAHTGNPPNKPKLQIIYRIPAFLCLAIYTFGHLNIFRLRIDELPWPERHVDDEGLKKTENVEKIEKSFFPRDRTPVSLAKLSDPVSQPKLKRRGQIVGYASVKMGRCAAYNDK